VNIVDETLDKKSELVHHFLYALVSATRLGDPPQLAPVLQNQVMWDKVYKSRGVSRDKWTGDTKLNQLLNAVYDLLVSTAERIVAGSVTLRELHIALDNREAFLALLELLKSKTLTSKILQTRADALKAFDDQLAEAKCYVTFFCNCGVLIEAEELKENVVDLAKRYDSLILEKVKGSFKNIGQYSADISWLYSLRSSALFLALWRETGNAIIGGRDPFADIKGGDKKEEKEKKVEKKGRKERRFLLKKKEKTKEKTKI